MSATFFVAADVGRSVTASVRTIAAAGHDVQLHCHRHVRHTLLREAEVERDARAALEVIAAGGVSPTLWRTPWGVCTPATVRVARRLGLQIVRWDIDTHDWRGDTAPVMLAHVRRRFGAGGSVLMHDGLGPGGRRSGCENTVALIAPLVRVAAEHGLRIGPLAPARE